MLLFVQQYLMRKLTVLVLVIDDIIIFKGSEDFSMVFFLSVALLSPSCQSGSENLSQSDSWFWGSSFSYVEESPCTLATFSSLKSTALSVEALKSQWVFSRLPINWVQSKFLSRSEHASSTWPKYYGSILLPWSWPGAIVLMTSNSRLCPNLCRDSILSQAFGILNDWILWKPSVFSRWTAVDFPPCE